MIQALPRNEPRADEYNLIWKHTHPDYRGISPGGVRHILVGSRPGGTHSVPVQSLTAAEHAEHLAYARNCEARGRPGWK